MIIFGIILFAISFILVFASSYLISSLLAEKNSPLGLLYIPIIAFAQVVLTFEILSLFNAITTPAVLTFNILISIITYKIWNKKNRPLWYFEKDVTKRFFKKIKNSFKLDKTLIVLGICYAIFILTAAFLAFIMPVTSGDGKMYHIARSFFFVANHNLNHFVTNDIRALCLPINSEILYAWVILFIKKDVLLPCFAFVGYIMSMVAAFDIMGYLKFSYRRRLWVIFIISSFASVIVQASSTETDIILTALIGSAMYMFWTALKTDKKIPVFMAALAYAIAIGTKTPSIIMIPAVGFFMLTLCFYYKKFKPLGIFIGYGIINFVIFSAYNYVLNFIEYKNIAGPEYFMIVSKNYYGIKGAFANFLKYIFMFFDFTGFRWGDYMMEDLLKIKDGTLAFFGLANMQDGLYTTNDYFQRSLIEQCMGGGILGFLVFLPCWIFTLFTGFTKNKTKKMLFIYSLMLLINLIVISCLLSYMSYSVRFLMAFMVLSCPILAYTYYSNKNPLKYVIIYFSIFYLAFVSTHIWVRPFVRVVKYIKHNPSIKLVRQIAICSDYYSAEGTQVDCKVRHHITKYKPGTKILLLPESSMNYVGYGKLMLQGYKIDIGEPERLSFDTQDLSEYDLIISPMDRQRSTVINDYENRKDDCLVEVSGDRLNSVKCVVPRPYDCFYEYNGRIPQYDKNGKRRTPFAVICNVTPKYVTKRDFYVSRVVGLDGPPDSLISNYFIFYQNKAKKMNLKPDK